MPRPTNGQICPPTCAKSQGNCLESIAMQCHPDSRNSTTKEKVWFVDLITHYFPRRFVPVHLPVHLTLEECAEILNAKYIAVADQNCARSIGTEKWLRVLQNNWASSHFFYDSLKQGRYYLAFKNLSSLYELWFRTRALLKDINNNATCIIIYLDIPGAPQDPLEMLVVWLAAFSSVATRNKTIVWTHIHQMYFQERRRGRFVRSLLKVFPMKTWRTAYTSQIEAENRKYGWVIDILPHPLNPALNAVACNQKTKNTEDSVGVKSDQLVCWLLMTRPDQGLELLPSLIGHRSARNFPKKFIKCFVSDQAIIKESDEIELVRLPFGSEDYHWHFNQCEVVLLPYNAYLFSGLSGIFMEAIATAKIPIVSDGTVMAQELRKFGLGGLVMDFTNAFSWTLINEIREDPGIRARIHLMAEAYAKEHDAFACAQFIYNGLKKINSKISLSEPKRTS